MRMDSTEECESAFSLRLRYDVASEINREADSNSDAPYFVFYFQNGTRLWNNLFQKKSCSKCERVLKNLNNQFFIPFERRTSEESLACETTDFAAITSVVYHETLKAVSSAAGAFNYRFCLETISKAEGADFFLTGEVEYDQRVSQDYEKREAVENVFWSDLLSSFEHVLSHVCFSDDIFSSVEHTSLLTVPCRRFHKLASKSFNPKESIIKFKFDGFKGKLYLGGDGCGYYTDDLYAFEVIPAASIPETLKRPIFRKVLLQLEILDERRLVIVTDILGVQVGTNLFRPEPKEVLRFLESLRLNDGREPRKVTIGGTEFVLGTQFSIVKSVLDSAVTREHEASINKSLFDGFILISANREYKFKIPTIDVVVERQNASQFLYIVSDGQKKRIGSCIQNLSLTTERDESFIYEACKPIFTDTCNTEVYSVLRRRFDRQFTSTLQEYESFLAECEFLKRILVSKALAEP